MKIAQQTRDEIVRLYSQHVPIREIMRRLEVSRSSIYNFLKFDKMHISSNGCMAITFRQITSMESELNRLRQGYLWNKSGRNDGKMIFFSDSKQNIYQPTSDAMQQIQQKLNPEPIELTANLRNTKTIFDKCRTLIDLSETREPVQDGVPNIERALFMSEALDEISNLLRQFPRSDFAVLTSSTQMLSDIRINGCSFNSAVNAQAVRQWKSGRIAWKSTIHAFKGLEAPCVVLLIPQSAANPQNGNDFLQYIGASRAQYQLVIYTITP